MLGVIAGTGFYSWDLLENPEEKEIETPYGSAVVCLGKAADSPVAFLPRHRKNHSLPPHKINYRANIYALYSVGVSRLVAINAVGSLDKHIGPGELVLVDDFMDFTQGREQTFYDGENGRVGHADMTECYCPDLQRLIRQAAVDAEIALHTGGVYVATQGPRFETRAEIRAFARLGGTVVGMTGAPECQLAVELGICYAGVSCVTNYGCGIGSALSSEDIAAVVADNKIKLERLLKSLAAVYTEEKSCRCGVDECLL